MSNRACWLFIAFCALIAPAITVAEKPSKLTKHQLVKLKVGKKSVQCGLLGSKWSVVKKTSGKYVLDKKASADGKKACAQLLGKGKLTSLGKIPSASTIAKAKGGKAKTAGFSASAVSGIPPVLSEIPSLDISDLFWRSGVVQAVAGRSASQNQCSEFYGGLGTDGASGGFPACYVSQGVGFSFETILSGGTSLCYMKKAPTQANLEGGAVSLVSGNLPAGGVTSLFNTPAGSAARIVKVIPANMPGDEDQIRQEEIFIRVYPQAALLSSGDHYKAELLFCSPGEQTPHSVQEMRVKLTGEFVSFERGNQGDGSSRNTVQAFLKGASNGVEFDPARPRSATASWVSPSGNEVFKSEIQLTADDIIVAKTYDSFGGQERKAVAVAHFSGSDMADFRYDQAAYKHSMQQGSENTVVEYRNPYYVISEDSETASGVDLLDVRDSISFTGDSFFQSLDPGSFDVSAYSCSQTPDIVVGIDFSNPLMMAVASECEGDRLDGMDFCRGNELVRAAEQNFPMACMGGMPQPGIPQP